MYGTCSQKLLPVILAACQIHDSKVKTGHKKVASRVMLAALSCWTKRVDRQALNNNYAFTCPTYTPTTWQNLGYMHEQFLALSHYFPIQRMIYMSHVPVYDNRQLHIQLRVGRWSFCGICSRVKAHYDIDKCRPHNRQNEYITLGVSADRAAVTDTRKLINSFANRDATCKAINRSIAIRCRETVAALYAYRHDIYTL